MHHAARAILQDSQQPEKSFRILNYTHATGWVCGKHAGLGVTTAIASRMKLCMFRKARVIFGGSSTRPQLEACRALYLCANAQHKHGGGETQDPSCKP